MNYTAEQLAINISTDLANGIIDNQRIVDIQTYARQCAKKALEDAYENQIGMSGDQEIKLSILETEIKTP